MVFGIGEINHGALGFCSDVDNRQLRSSELLMDEVSGQQSEAKAGHGRVAHHETVVDAQYRVRAYGHFAARFLEAPIGRSAVAEDDPLMLLQLGEGFRPAELLQIGGRCDEKTAAGRKAFDNDVFVHHRPVTHDCVIAIRQKIDEAVVEIESQLDPRVVGEESVKRRA